MSDGDNFVETRVVDRSGDIDQRPLEELKSAPIPSLEKQALVTLTAAEKERRTASPAPSLSSSQSQKRDAVSPQSADPELPEVTALVSRHQAALDNLAATSKTKLKTFLSEIEKQEAQCSAPDLDPDLQHIRFQRQKVLIGSGPLLADYWRSEQSRLQDLETFKTNNGLTRDAHYPSSQILSLGILFMLVVIEAGLNGVLFAGSSDQGLFGGWLEAVILSITNVGAAFLLGRLVLPHLNQRTIFARGTAASFALLGATLLLTINLLGAHYRDYKTQLAQAPSLNLTQSLNFVQVAPAASSSKAASKPLTKEPAPSILKQPAEAKPLSESGEFQALNRTFQSPLALQSFTSVFLLIIGLCAAVIAAWDGYKLDDPYPGYGRRHRLYVTMRAKRMQTLTRILKQANSIMQTSFQQAQTKIDRYDHDIARLDAVHQNYQSEWQRLSDELETATARSEAEVTAHCRLVHKRTSLAPMPIEALAQITLPTIPLNSVKILEQHQKKCASLKKAVIKEQASLVELFARSSIDFQAVLAQMSQADFIKTQAPAPVVQAAFQQDAAA